MGMTRVCVCVRVGEYETVERLQRGNSVVRAKDCVLAITVSACHGLEFQLK